MRSLIPIALALLGACATPRVASVPTVVVLSPAPAPVVEEPPRAPVPEEPGPQVPDVVSAAASFAVDDDDDRSDVDAEIPDAAPDAAAASPDLRYSSDLTDERLLELWKEAPEKLGSMSIGFVEQGRLINGVQFPAAKEWRVVSPNETWGTQETVDFVMEAIYQVNTRYPAAPPLNVNQFSAREGGYLRPHKSHQNGRDVDLGFYYRNNQYVRAREREKYIDPALNWELVKALVTRTDVQYILVDRRIQKVLYDFALKSGEDKGWLDSLFNAGAASIVRHVKRHRDHFHVRFFNGRSQELGRRIVPLLAQRPEQNLALHRVQKGDTLGGIAARYGSSVQGIRRANGLKTNLLRLAQVLKVPLRKPCTRCPLPPPVEVPPRRLPPDFQGPTEVSSAAAP